MSVNAWDLGCILTIVISAIAGYISGFVWDTGRWLGAVVGVLAANQYCVIADLYHWQTAGVWILIAMVTWGACLVCISKLSRIILKSPVAIIDKTVGAVAACVRGCLLLVVAFSTCTVLLQALPKEVYEAWSYQYLDCSSQYLRTYMQPIIDMVRRHLSV